MNKDQAIDILKQQKSKLRRRNDNIGNVEVLIDGTWKTQTESYIKLFFSEKSPEFDHISHFMLYELPTLEAYAYKAIPGLETFIDNCVESVKNNGLYRIPRGNFLSRLNEGTLVTILIFAIPGLLTVGTLFGKYLSDTQNIELRSTVKTLKDSLILLRNPAPQHSDAVSNQSANTANRAKQDSNKDHNK